jgi:hypothetical protein
MLKKIKYSFTATLWQHSGHAAWHFVSLPGDLAQEIRKNLGWQEEAWGRLKATASIEDSEWDTAIWFDTKQNTYLLPIKADIRKNKEIQPGSEVKITLGV